MKKIVTFIILILLLISILYGVKIMFYSEEDGELYGDRLDGIDDIDISALDYIPETLMLEEAISAATISIQGKLINMHITAEEFADTAYVKKAATAQINLLSEEILTYYDAQIFITKTTEDETIYSIGYKNKNSDTFYWTN